MQRFFEKLFKSSLIYGVGAIASPIVGFFLLPLYTRYLTPSDYGILETLVATTSILSIFIIFGMDNSLFRFSFDSSNINEQNRVLNTTGVFIWGFSAITIAILIFAAKPLTGAFFKDQQYYSLLIIAFLTAGITAIQKIPLSVFRINNQAARYALLMIGQILITTILCIAFVAGLNLGVRGVIFGTLISITFLTFIAYLFITSRIKFNFSLFLFKKMIRYSAPVVPAGLALWVLSLSDRYFLIWYSTQAELGLYSIGAKFASIVAIGIAAFRLAWPQAAYSIIKEKNKNTIYARALTYFLFLSSGVTIGISLFGKELVSLMTASDFHEAYSVIPILSLGFVFNGCYTILAIGMGLKKQNFMLFPATVIPAIVNLILNYYLIPDFGMHGAAWATLLSYLLMAGLTWLASERVHHIDYEWKKIIIILAVTAGILLINWYLNIAIIYITILIKLCLSALYFLILRLLNIPNKVEYKLFVDTLVRALGRNK